MGEYQPSDLIGPALTAACSLLSRYPKARIGDEASHRLLKAFTGDPAVRAYLRSCRTVDVLDGTAVEQLLDLAEDWMAHGQRHATACLYETRSRSSLLGTLGVTDRLVHRAVFALALSDGPRARASERYMQALLVAEFGHAVSHVTVRASYRRLHERHLIEYLPGKRTPGRRHSTVLSLAPFLRPAPEEPSAQTLDELLLSPSTWAELLDYRVRSRSQARAGEQARKGRDRSQQAPPDEIGDDARGRGSLTHDQVQEPHLDPGVRAVILGSDFLRGIDL